MLKDTIAALKDEVASLSKLVSKLQKERSDQTSSAVPATHSSYATVAQATTRVPEERKELEEHQPKATTTCCET